MLNQATRGEKRRVMYVENKDGQIDGISARIGWVTFSKTGLTIYYRDKVLKRSKGQGIRGNYYDEESGDEFWVSGVKRRGSNAHWAEPVDTCIDSDAMEEYKKIKGQL